MTAKAAIAASLLMVFVLCLAAHAAPATAPATTVVAIVQGQDPDKLVAEALELIGGLKGLVKDGDVVVIKPNMVTPDHVDIPGLMTRADVTAAVVRQIQAVAKCRIILAEGAAASGRPGDKTSLDGFKLNGYTPLVEKLGVELLDLNTDQRVKVKGSADAYPEFELPRTIMTCNVLIDMPVLKTHQLTGVTLGMKNLFGLMPVPKARYHEKIDQLLCDIIRARKPDLTIIDGIWGTEGQGPLMGKPIRRDLIIAGRDIVAVDSVATTTMGYEPWRIHHLDLAARQGLGIDDLSRIEIKGKSVDSVKRLFDYATWEAVIVYPRSEELAKKVLASADRVQELKWRAQSYGKTAIFNADRLQPDAAKYPLRKSYGFIVRILDDENTIEFSAPFEAVFRENCQAAVEEMARFIDKNIQPKDKPTFAGFKSATLR